MLDLKLTGGRIVDGSGNPWYQADIGIVGDRISSIGDLKNESARKVINADGLTVSPGFIDMHSHSDLQLLIDPAHEAKICQGVTTEVIGQDGLSYAPVSDQTLNELREQLSGWNGNPEGLTWSWRSVRQFLSEFEGGVAANVAFLVPHGTLRMMVVGLDDRKATGPEMNQMKLLLRQGLIEGAVGLSSGLTYTPGMYADDEELIALCKAMRSLGGYYCPHHRNYGSAAIEGYGACIEIAREAGVPLHLAHAHLGFEVNRGKSLQLIELIDAGRNSGVDITFDTYPYLAGATYLHALLPSWVLSGGHEASLARLRDREVRARIRVEMEDVGSDGFHQIPVDWNIVVISGVREPRNLALVGKSLMAAAAQARQDPIDFYCDLLIAERLGTSALLHIGNEDNVRALMRHPAHTAGSDGILVGARPHPRGWGTFARYIATYARDLQILSLEGAIRKMTSLPAQRLRMLDRGLLRPGMFADIVCFDYGRMQDLATYEDPRRTPSGIPYVLINGSVAVNDGVRTESMSGRPIRRNQFVSFRTDQRR